MVLDTLRAKLTRGGRYLLAVSGGADSICLLHAANSLRGELSLHLEVAHVNHNLRAASKQDEEFVSEAVARRSLPFHLHKAQDPPQSNVEAWGRRVRYLFFNSVAAERGLDAVLTAHTADDAVETFLMRLLANKEPRTIASEDAERKVLRPFLAIWRSSIEEYLRAEGQTFRNDESNDDTRFTRNRIRRSLIPFLEENFDGDAKRILLSQASNIAQDIELLDDMVSELVSDASQNPFGSREWLRTVREHVLNLDERLAWRYLDRLFRPVLGFGLGRPWCARLNIFLKGNAPRMELPSKWVVTRKDGGIIASQRA